MKTCETCKYSSGETLTCEVNTGSFWKYISKRTPACQNYEEAQNAEPVGTPEASTETNA